LYGREAETMSLSLKQSQAVYKKEVLAKSGGKKYTDSPLKDPKIKKKVDKLMKDQGVNDPTLVPTRVIDSEEVGEDENIGSNKSVLSFDRITNLISDVSHLDGYNVFEEDLGLDGENYLAMKRWLIYYQNSIMQDTISYDINKKTKCDNRTHGLIISGAGQGKTTIKNQNKRVLKKFDETEGYIEVAGVSHPEQFVGKIAYEGKGANKRPVEKLGIMGYKCVMNDEAQEMLNENNDIYAKAQRIKRLAMDTFGENKISKKLVSDSPKDVLEYDSPSRVCDFAHPDKLSSAFFDTGSFRRYFAFNITAENNINIDDVTSFDFDNKVKTVNWGEFLNSKYKRQTNVTFNKKTLEIISQFHKSLLIYLLKHKNPNAFRYGLMTRYSLRSVFCKYLLVLSKARGESTPTLYTTLSACSDVVLFILKSIETYNDLGNMGTSADVWGGCCEEDAQALEYLLRNKSTTRESSTVSIKKFQSLLAHFYGCKVTQSRAHYYRLKRNGFVNSSQDGMYGSKVWLTFIPADINLDCGDYDSLKFWDSYVKGVGPKNVLLTALKSHFTDDKEYEKSKGDGGVGVMGCVLIKNVLCVQPLIDKNKNNNYIYGCPQNPTPLTPSPKSNDLHVKSPKEGAKTPKKRPTPLKSKPQRTQRTHKTLRTLKSQPVNKSVKVTSSINGKSLDSNPTTVRSVRGVQSVRSENEPKSDRDTHYNEDPVCADIVDCNKEEVLKYTKKHKDYKLADLIKKFGPGVMKLKSEGLIQ
jgi:hypothetical protein